MNKLLLVSSANGQTQTVVIQSGKVAQLKAQPNAKISVQVEGNPYDAKELIKGKKLGGGKN